MPLSPEKQAQLIQTILDKPVFVRGIGDRTKAGRAWGVAAGGALKALAQSPSITDQTKGALIQMISGANTGQDLPFSESVTQRIRPAYEDISFDGQWMSPIGPIASVLAQHQVADVVPVLVSRYFNTGTGSKTQEEIFYALVNFNDARALPVYENFLVTQRRVSQVDPDQLILDIVPTIVEAGLSKDLETQAASEHLLSGLRATNPDPTFQNALSGQGPRRDPNAFSFVQLAANGRFKRTESPFEKNLQGNFNQFKDATTTDLAKKDGQIADLRDQDIKLAQKDDALEKNISETNQAVTALNEKYTGLLKQFKSLEVYVSKLDEETKAEFESVRYDVLKSLSEMESQLNHKISAKADAAEVDAKFKKAADTAEVTKKGLEEIRTQLQRAAAEKVQKEAASKVEPTTQK